MTEIKFSFSKNGEEKIAYISNIVSFLSDIDAQPGTLEESGMESIIKNKISITVNEEKFWTPLSIKEFCKIVAKG